MDTENTGFYRRVLAGFAWQGAAKFVVQAVSWVSTIVVARILDPSDYGLMAIAGVFILPMMALMEMGLAQALVQRKALNEEEENLAFTLSLLLGFSLFLLLFQAAPLIAGFYEMPALADLLRLCGVGLIISSLKTVPYAILMRRLDFRSRAFVEVIASLVSAVTVVTLAVAGFGLWSLAWATVVQQLVLILGYLPAFGRWPRLRFRFARITDLIRFGMHVMGANLAYLIASRADVFIAGKFLGAHLSGVYALGFQLSTMPLDKIGSIFNNVAFPSLSRMKDDEIRCRELFLEMHRYLLFITYPALIGLAAVADDLVFVLLGQKWGAMVPILQALCVVNVVRVSGMLISPALNARGRSRDAMVYSMAGAVIMPLAFLACVHFGLEGLAIAWLLGYPLLYALLLHFLRRDLHIRFADLVIGSRPTLVATVLMAGCVLLFREATPEFSPLLRLIGSIGIGALAYTAVFLIFYGEHVAHMRRALRALRSGSSA